MIKNLSTRIPKVLEPEEAISAWKRICEGLYHFNSLSNSCRLLASTWLLASFAAIGYVSTQKTGFNAEILIPILGVLSSLGILVLWIMDQLVYIRFIEAYFYEALEIEKTYVFLPKVNSNMPLLFGKKGVVNFVRVYYLGCIIAPIVLTLLSIFPKDSDFQKNFVYAFFVFALIIIISTGSYLFFQKPEYQELIARKKKKAQQDTSIEAKKQRG